MGNFFRNFATDQNGAISVEWVVLAAFLTGLTFFAMSAMSGSLDVLIEYIRLKLTT